MDTNRNNLIRQILVAVAIFLTIIINILANALPINGQNTGDISDQFDVYFVPAGYVFAIWGLIYIGLIAYAIYQALPAQRNSARLRNIDGLVILSSIANSAWIFCWHYGYFALSLLAMLILLASLIGVYLRLNIGKSQVSTAERWLTEVPFSIYLGWITVATVANVTDVLDFYNWNGRGISPEIWFVIVTLVAVAIAALVAIRRQDVAYLAVLVWAFIGIAVKHSDVTIVAVFSLMAALAAVALIVFSVIQRRKSSRTLTSVGKA